jgi:hypothetical protein
MCGHCERAAAPGAFKRFLCHAYFSFSGNYHAADYSRLRYWARGFGGFARHNVAVWLTL